MTKQKMIETLRLKEGNAWYKLQDHEEYCQTRFGETCAYKDWSKPQQDIYDRYVIIWVALSDTLKDLDVECYNYKERLILKNQNLNSL